jgi:tetratricopeptide (TPR) repeat protein
MRDHLQAVLDQTGGNITHTAAILGIARNTLRSRIRKLGIKGSGALAPPSTPREEAPLAAPGLATEPEVTPAPRAAAVRWERRHVTLLRVALSGTAGESLFAGQLLSLAAEKALGFGGRIEALGQTRLDASFGAVPIENAARRAVSAALAFHKAILEAAQPGFAGTTLIHTEQTTVGQTGDALMIDDAHRAVLGGTLDRMAKHASPGVVQVSGMTAPFLARHFELRGDEVSGAAGEPSFIVVRPDPSGLGAWRRLTRFVGRQAEMEVLRSRWELASRGRGQVVGLVGEPGVGKSRLLLEFTRTLDQVSALVLHMATSATEDPSRSRPAAALLGSLFAIEPGDGADEIRGKLAARLSALELEPELLPPLAALLDVEAADEAWTQIDPQQRARRMLDALRRLIVRESVDRPVTIVLEDLHWIDADTQIALDHLIDVVPTARILFVVAYRPEYRPGWSGKTFYTQLSLDSLPVLAADELLDDLLGVTPDMASLKPQLLAWTEGNPFFLEEAVRTLVETGGLAGAPGAYRVADSVVVRTLPATVEDTLAARIHRLPADVRHVLQCAAAIGIEFAHDVLTSLVNLGEETLAMSLRALEDAEFVYPVASAATPAHIFKHGLTHLVTYRSVSPERQRILHAHVLRSLETLHSGQPEVQVEALAEHAFRAELWESAAGYLQAAGTRALARSATRTAVDHLDRAIVALDRVERRRDVLERAIDIRLDLRYALALLGQYERALPRLREAEALALELNDTVRQGRVVSFLANGLYLLGDHAGAITAARRATEIAQLLDDFPTRVTADIYAGRALHVLGRYRESTELFRGVVDAFSGEHANEYAGLPVLPAAYARSYLAMGLSELGDFAAALAAGHEAVAIAEATGHPDTIQWACYALGLTLLDRGDADGAIVLLERALSICRSAELPVYVPRAAAALGHAFAVCGRDDGLALLEGAARDSETPSQRNIQARTLARLAEVYLLAGRIPEGTDRAERSLTLAKERGERGSEAHALRVLALAYEALSRVDESRTAHERALALATEAGMQLLVALCHLGLGRLERVAHRRAEAATHLLAAHEAFERLEMARWDHATVAELALLG